jgi:hypothetical protein
LKTGVEAIWVAPPAGGIIGGRKRSAGMVETAVIILLYATIVAMAAIAMGENVKLTH